MLHSRIIPCLLVKNKGLVKTVQFGAPTYVGDPINTAKIFNEKRVDELIVLDIDATTEGREPDYKMIENLAAECRMPLCYGGGIKTAEQARRIFNLGVEKIVLSSAAVANPGLVSRLAGHVGRQSIAVALDVRLLSGERYEVFTHNGRNNSKRDPVELARELEGFGVGEILVNSIDRDGMMKGYDLTLVKKIRDTVSVPMTVLGGAGSLDDISSLISLHGIIGAAAGSLFIFKGIYRAVLVNYPDPSEKAELIQKSYGKFSGSLKS